MASNDSDSEVDFESADEGEIDSTAINQNETQPEKSAEPEQVKNPPLTDPNEKQLNSSKLTAKVEIKQNQKAPHSQEDDTFSSEDSKENQKAPEPKIPFVGSLPKANKSNITENVQEKSLSDVKDTKSQSNLKNTNAEPGIEIKDKSPEVPNEKSTKLEGPNFMAKIGEKTAKIARKLSNPDKVTNDKKSGDEKSAKALEESKTRAKSEDKDPIKSTRKLSNPEKTSSGSSRVMLHIEKKALEKSNSKSSNQLSEKEASVLDRLSAPKEEKKTSPGWGGLGNWGTSFISSAASSVSTFTSHVTQGIETVLETVEASLGAPTPEELAATLAKKEEENSDKVIPERQNSSDSSKGVDSHDGILPGSLLGGVSALTKALESTGSKVLTGGLDTLELIGKKTMDILTEGDPGLRNKRNIFAGNETNLSHVLREARDRLESTSTNDSSYEDPFPVHYSKLFDEFQGLVHLEALEMLSSQSKNKLQDLVLALESEGCDTLVARMEEIRTLCEDLPPTDDTPDDETTQDFNKLITEHISALPFKISFEKIKGTQAETKEWLEKFRVEQDRGEAKDAKDIYIKAITVLAKLSALMMELYHKIAELLLVSGCPLNELYSHSKHLTSLTSVLCLEIGILTSEFCRCLNTAADDSEDPDSINPFITNVYLEASNSNSYIQDAFCLLIPVLQEIASNSIES